MAWSRWSWAARQRPSRQRPDSDVDLGLLLPGRPPARRRRRQARRRGACNDTPNPVVTPLGGWGTLGQRRLLADHPGVPPTDLLYRDLDFVTEDRRRSASGTGRTEESSGSRPRTASNSEIYCAERLPSPLYDPQKTSSSPAQGRRTPCLPGRLEAATSEHLAMERPIHRRQRQTRSRARRGLPGRPPPDARLHRDDPRALRPERDLVS